MGHGDAISSVCRRLGMGLLQISQCQAPFCSLHSHPQCSAHISKGRAVVATRTWVLSRCVPKN